MDEPTPPLRIDWHVPGDEPGGCHTCSVGYATLAVCTVTVGYGPHALEWDLCLACYRGLCEPPRP